MIACKLMVTLVRWLVSSVDASEKAICEGAKTFKLTGKHVELVVLVAV